MVRTQRTEAFLCLSYARPGPHFHARTGACGKDLSLSFLCLFLLPTPYLPPYLSLSLPAYFFTSLPEVYEGLQISNPGLSPEFTASPLLAGTSSYPDHIFTPFGRRPKEAVGRDTFLLSLYGLRETLCEGRAISMLRKVIF